MPRFDLPTNLTKLQRHIGGGTFERGDDGHPYYSKNGYNVFYKRDNINGGSIYRIYKGTSFVKSEKMIWDVIKIVSPNTFNEEESE